jgi:hypothetical protein
MSRTVRAVQIRVMTIVSASIVRTRTPKRFDADHETA